MMHEFIEPVRLSLHLSLSQCHAMHLFDATFAMHLNLSVIEFGYRFVVTENIIKRLKRSLNLERYLIMRKYKIDLN